MQYRIPEPSQFLKSEIYRTITRVAFGLQSTTSAPNAELSIPGNPLAIQLTLPPKLSHEEIRGDCQNWILANGLRNCAESIAPVLEWARQLCFLMSRTTEKAQPSIDLDRHEIAITVEEWEKVIVKYAITFDRMGFVDKVAHLDNTYGLKPSPLAQHLASLSRARNCLTHRRGIIGPEDIKGQSSRCLDVSWLRPRGEVQTKEGVVPLELPFSGLEGDTIWIRQEAATKRFPLGESLTFTTEDFVGIALTYLAFSDDLQRSVSNLEKNRQGP